MWEINSSDLNIISSILFSNSTPVVIQLVDQISKMHLFQKNVLETCSITIGQTNLNQEYKGIIIKWKMLTSAQRVKDMKKEII